MYTTQVPRKLPELKYRYGINLLVSDMHCKRQTNQNRLGHLTNQSRVASQKQGFKETESFIDPFQTLQEIMLQICIMWK